MRNRIKNTLWFNFLFKYNYPKSISFGNGKQGYYSFRMGMIISILLVIVFFITIFV